MILINCIQGRGAESTILFYIYTMNGVMMQKSQSASHIVYSQLCASHPFQQTIIHPVLEMMPFLDRWLHYIPEHIKQLLTLK